MVVIDYYSRWIDVKMLHQPTSAAVIARLKTLFTTFGIPEKVISDNGSQYSSQEFASFAKTWGFSHSTTNPYKPQENGMAERAVQTVKGLLRLDEPELGLLNYRATPHSATGVSPAVALMGRQIQTRLPILASQLKPVIPNDKAIRMSDERAKENYKRNYDTRHGARELPSLYPGDHVLIKTAKDRQWSQPAEITNSLQDNRSYLVEKPGEGVFRRNRTDLQKVEIREETPSKPNPQPPSPMRRVPDEPSSPSQNPVMVPIAKPAATPSEMIRRQPSRRNIQAPKRFRDDEWTT